MTKQETALYAPLMFVDTAYLTKYISPNGKLYYRLLTDDHRPLRNVTGGCFKTMNDKGWIGTRRTGGYTLNVTLLKQAYDKRIARAQSRADREGKARHSGGKQKTKEANSHGPF